jgi:hypothetical protein
MKRIQIFAKGNVDIHDSLHSSKVNNVVVWNGINTIIRNKYPGFTVRLKHETWTRSDALLGANGIVPFKLANRHLNLGSYPLNSQFSSLVFEAEPDLFVFSIQPDVMSNLMRHNIEDFLFFANDAASWTTVDRAWLSAEFTSAGYLTAEVSFDNFNAIISRIRAQSDAPILIYNLSSAIPGDIIHCYVGMEGSISSRIKKFNLKLTELSEQTGVSIVDVDALLAKFGANQLQIDTTHLTAGGYEIVAHEVVRILEDLAFFD